MSEKEKMLKEKLYIPFDEELGKRNALAYELCLKFNSLHKCDLKRKEILKELCPNLGQDITFVGPIWFDYGDNIYSGDHIYANYNFVVLDCAKIYLGSNVFFGPNVTLATPLHPLLAKERAMFLKDGNYVDQEYAKEIHIGSNCWIASNVVICGGVHIGEGSVIGAGSVVTRDVPPHTLAYGVPCKVIRKIDENDSIYLKKELL